MSEPLKVTVRYSCGTYLARCNGKTASCTSGPESAASRAAAKAFGVDEMFVQVDLLEQGPNVATSVYLASEHKEFAV